jgi:uncharacterized protein (DUF736 family)
LGSDSVTRGDHASYKGQLRPSPSGPTAISFANRGHAEAHPDFRILTQGVEIDAGWIVTVRTAGADDMNSLHAAPEFGPRKLYANLG